MSHNATKSRRGKAYVRYLYIKMLLNCIFQLWGYSSMRFFFSDSLSSKWSYRTFELNPHIPSKAKEKMRPYLIPDSHPMKKQLDSIFHSARVTLNEQTFAAAGFHTFSVRPRSFRPCCQTSLAALLRCKSKSRQHPPSKKR